MAVWQVPFALVPRKRWDPARAPALPIWDGVAELWSGEVAARWTMLLEAALGTPAEYWDAKGRMWGTYDEHCIELSWTDGGVVDQVQLRIDVRARDTTLVKQLLDFAGVNELLLLTSEGQAVEPNLESLVPVVKASAAARFVRDPIAFLESLRDSQ